MNNADDLDGFSSDAVDNTVVLEDALPNVVAVIFRDLPSDTRILRKRFHKRNDSFGKEPSVSLRIATDVVADFGQVLN